MRFGIIDLGTNSVRFDVHQVGSDGQARLLHREKLMVRLGQGVFLKGRLNADARRRTVQAFRSFARTCEDLSVKRVLAFGTSALREANDKAVLIDEIREATGIEVKVISGAEEARLISLGILSHEERIKGRFALIDIGGGSTEISICHGRKVLHSESFPLGTARLQQVFLKSSPPQRKNGRDPVEELRKYIRSVLLPVMRGEQSDGGRWPKVDRVLGSSGTIKVIYRILRKTGSNKHPLQKGVSTLVSEMEEMGPVELQGIPGMEAKRVDMILAGAVLFEECLMALGAKKFSFTPFALRDGVLEEEIELVSSHQKSHLGLHMDDLVAKARRCGVHEGHLQSVREVSVRLFDRLKAVHQLKSEWRPFLEAAAILHDVGEVVNPAHHGRHSYYIAKNVDVAALDAWELEFVAQLCFWHAGGKPDLRKIPELREKSRQQAFLKLLAILRIADALDRSHKADPCLRDVKLKRGMVELKLDPRKSSDLEVLRVEQKKELFEEVFRRKLVVKRGR
jgi:exopolyphosphatase/guanosine-5'-triphosphate,3'-diphosphate pyrophosphatase